MDLRHLTLLLLLLGLSLSTFADCPNANFQPVNLNAYYGKAIGQSGEALKDSLHANGKGHQAYSYSPCVWEIPEEDDEHLTHRQTNMATLGQQ